MLSRGAQAAEKSAPAKRGAPAPQCFPSLSLPQPLSLSSCNHGSRPASRCALHWTDLDGRRYWHDRLISLPFIFLFSQAGRPQQAAPATHMTVVRPPWNFFVKPAHPFLHVLPFERVCRLGDAAGATVIQLVHLPPIDSCDCWIQHILIDFEGGHSRPSCLGLRARRLISAVPTSRQ